MANECVKDVLAAMERVVEEAAAVGPWEYVDDEVVVVDDPDAPRGYPQASDLMAHQEIRAMVRRFDPPTLTALLAVVRGLHEALPELRAYVPATCDWHGPRETGCRPCWVRQQLAVLTDALDALTRPPQGAGG